MPSIYRYFRPPTTKIPHALTPVQVHNLRNGSLETVPVQASYVAELIAELRVLAKRADDRIETNMLVQQRLVGSLDIVSAALVAERRILADLDKQHLIDRHVKKRPK